MTPMDWLPGSAPDVGVGQHGADELGAAQIADDPGAREIGAVQVGGLDDGREEARALQVGAVAGRPGAARCRRGWPGSGRRRSAVASVRSQENRLAPASLLLASDAPVRLARLKSSPVRSSPLRSLLEKSGGALCVAAASRAFTSATPSRAAGESAGWVGIVRPAVVGRVAGRTIGIAISAAARPACIHEGIDSKVGIARPV